MRVIRIMTYHIHQCCGTDGRTDPDRVVEVIRRAAVDIVALQDVNSPRYAGQLAHLASRLHMEPFGGVRTGDNALLTRVPLRGVQQFQLGWGGCCQKADVDFAGQRLHLYNVRLSGGFFRYRTQAAALFEEELLGRHSASCPQLLVGDFADSLAATLLFNWSGVLQRTPRPFWSATYPARFPLLSRDRGYSRGGLRILDCAVQHGSLAREASTHLPVCFSIQLADTRQALRVKGIKRRPMETVPG